MRYTNRCLPLPLPYIHAEARSPPPKYYPGHRHKIIAAPQGNKHGHCAVTVMLNMHSILVLHYGRDLHINVVLDDMASCLQ